MREHGISDLLRRPGIGTVAPVTTGSHKARGASVAAFPAADAGRCRTGRAPCRFGLLGANNDRPLARSTAARPTSSKGPAETTSFSNTSSWRRPSIRLGGGHLPGPTAIEPRMVRNTSQEREVMARAKSGKAQQARRTDVRAGTQDRLEQALFSCSRPSVVGSGRLVPHATTRLARMLWVRWRSSPHHVQKKPLTRRPCRRDAAPCQRHRKMVTLPTCGRPRRWTSPMPISEVEPGGHTR